MVAREAGVGLKVIWREEVECGDWCGSMPPFNSSWPDLFSYPKLRLVPNFPGIALKGKYGFSRGCLDPQLGAFTVLGLVLPRACVPAKTHLSSIHILPFIVPDCSLNSCVATFVTLDE